MPGGASVDELLDDLSSRGVELWVENEKLRFRGPAGAVTPDLRDRVSARKEEIVAHLRASGPGDTRTAPLSFNQQSLYFLNRSLPASPAYNVGVALRVHSAVDAGALRDACQVLVDRHETLRTTYRAADDSPKQIVTSQRVALFSIDTSSLGDEQVDALVNAEFRAPFDLENGPVFRVHLFTRSAADHILLLSMHHIAADGSSLGTLLGELQALYRGHAEGRTVTLPAPRATYRDFVSAQRTTLAGPKGQQLWDYWRDRLADHPGALALPWDRTPVSDEGEGASIAFALSDALAERLKAIARDNSTTLFTVLMSAWQVLLSRYTGQTDILVGTAALGRKGLEFQPVVGDFMNTVIVRGDLSGNPTFEALLASIRARVFEAIDHEDYPFSLLVQRLHVKREPGRTPLFQTLLQLQKPMSSNLAELLVPPRGGRTAEFAGLDVEPYPLLQQEGQVDLAFEVVEHGASLFGTLKYRTDRFERATAERMCRHVEALLESVAATPGARIAELSIMPADERERVLHAWNSTDAAYAADTGVHTLVEAMAECGPARTAIAQGDRAMTYAELNARANRLASRLRRCGVGPGALVGLGLNRTPDLIAALLAVLKTGAAYLPLDPDFPAQRLGWMLEDADPLVLVTESALVNRWPASAGVPLLCLDDSSDPLDDEPSGNTPDAGNADSLAYTIFTSGSTGRPKGIQIPRRALVNLLGALQERLALTPADRLLAVTTLSFDIAVAELLLPLTVGATVELATREDAANPSRLASLIPGATVMQATPATWRMLCDAGWPGSPTLRVLCGGETLPPDLAARLMKRTAEVWNLYGPTETTVWSTAERLTRSDDITIGRPIANTRIYVVDAGRQLAPVGVAGEIWIGGDGVALGYLGQPELTAERFLDDPFRATGRIYRTGDVGRWRPDGRLEHLGRLDQQVKVRGFRIELPEIEAALLEMPGIREAAVLAEESGRGDRRLVAYIVAHDGTVTSDSVRTALRVRLPDYMVPTRMTRLEALPLTPNGKVDRRALAAMSFEPEPASHEFVAPRSASEQRLAAIWSEVLGVPRIGIHDNFFDLGGHSLLITQLASRLSVRHGIELPMSLLFDAPTVAQLAAAIDAPQRMSA